jgi:hypothetical protein
MDIERRKDSPQPVSQSSVSIKVFSSTELCVYGKEFRMLRYQNKLSLDEVCDAMRKKGWSYYPMKLMRLEKKQRFCMSSQELSDLLSCVGVSSQ